MALTSTYSTISSTQTATGKPLDTLLMDALRQNQDVLYEWLGGQTYTPSTSHDHDGVNSKKVSGVALTYDPFYSNYGSGADGALSYTTVGSTSTSIDSGLYQCVSFSVSSGVTVAVSTVNVAPLIIRATSSITIAGILEHRINWTAGISTASTDVKGDYYSYTFAGGSGGSAGTTSAGLSGPGGDAFLIHGGTVAPAASNGLDGTDQTTVAAALFVDSPEKLYLGGGGGGYEAGGNVGGAGGGVVILIAPIIDFTGVVRCSGNNGQSAGAGSGGGGGGVIITAASSYIADTGTRNVAGGPGGVGSKTAGTGGNGWSTSITV